ELGKVVATGAALRRWFALLSLLVIPVMIHLLRSHGASWFQAMAILACLVPTYIASLTDSLLEVAPKLHQAIAPLQRNQIETGASRAVFTLISLFTFPTCALALLSTGLARAWANIRLRKIVLPYADRDQKPDKEYRDKILKVVWRILPESVYYCFSSQITVWAISIFGSTASVAKLGGLTGLTQATWLLTVLISTLMVPRYARLPDRKPLLIQRFFMSQAALILLGLLMTGFAAVFHTPILWILGKQFAGLKDELTLAFASASVTLMNTTTNSLLSARGYVVPPAILIGFAIVTQVGLALIMPLQEVSGAILYGLYTALALYAIRLVYFFLQMSKHQETATA
ncbi:MAG TPA: hypothetical protein VIM62_00915, partial [Acidobacteriaceae bacterium]